MAIDLSTIIIDAKDLTGRAFDSVKGGLRSVETTQDRISSGFQRLAAFVSVGIFAGLIKSSIDAADRLNDLAQRTGLTVETLGGLDYVAKQTGTDLESVTKNVGRLQRIMLDAAAGVDKSEAAFKALNLEFKNADGSLRDTNKVLLDLADRFKDLPDGAEKAALAQKVFGKSGAEMIPLLNQGSESLREMIEEYQKYGGVTTETARRSDAFNDQMEKLKLVGGSLTRGITAELLPALQNIVTVFLDIKSSGDSVSVIGETLAFLLKTLATVAVGGAAAFQAVGKAIATTAAVMAELASGNYKQAFLVFKEGVIDGAESVQSAIDRVKKIWGDAPAVIAPAAAAAGTSIAEAFAKQHKTKIDEHAREVAKLFEEIAAKQAGVSPETLKKFVALDEQFKKGKITIEQYDKALQHLLDTDKLLIDEQKAIEKALEERNKQWREGFAIQSKAIEAIEKEIDQQNEYNKEIGKSKEQLLLIKAARLDDVIASKERALALHKERDADKEFTDSLEIEIERLRELRNSRSSGAALEAQAEETKKTEKQFLDMFERVDKTAHDVFVNIFEGGRDAFKRLGDTLKSTLLSVLYQMTVRPFIINLVANITGQQGIAQQMLGATSGGGGTGSLLSSLGGSLFGGGGLLGGSFMGGFGLGAGGLGMGMPAAGGLTSLGSMVGQGAASLFGTTGASAIGSVLSTIGTAMPYIAAAYAIYQLLAKPRGGAKEGGSFFGEYSQGQLSREQFDRFYTPSSQDQTLRDVITNVQRGFQQTLTSLGGRSGNVVFGLGYDTDPKGTAPNRIGAQVDVGGRSVYSLRDVALGRDQGALNDRLQLEAKRIMLVALQSSELPEEIKNILNQVQVSTASSEAIDRIIKIATAYKQAIDSMGGLEKVPERLRAAFQNFTGDEAELDRLVKFINTFRQATEALNADIGKIADERIAAEGRSLYENYIEQGRVLRELIPNLDDSQESLERLTQATVAYRETQISLLVEIERVRRALGEMFNETRRTLEFSVLDQQGKYNFLQTEADRLRDIIATSLDPAEIQRNAQLVNRNILDAFNLLSEQDRQSQLPAFLQRLAEFERLVQDRLAAARGTITADTRTNENSPLFLAAQKFEQLMEKFAETVNIVRESAQTNQQAADTQLDAANTQLEVSGKERAIRLILPDGFYAREVNA